MCEGTRHTLVTIFSPSPYPSGNSRFIYDRQVTWEWRAQQNKNIYFSTPHDQSIILSSLRIQFLPTWFFSSVNSCRPSSCLKKIHTHSTKYLRLVTISCHLIDLSLHETRTNWSVGLIDRLLLLFHTYTHFTWLEMTLSHFVAFSTHFHSPLAASFFVSLSTTLTGDLHRLKKHLHDVLKPFIRSTNCLSLWVFTYSATNVVSLLRHFWGPIELNVHVNGRN